MHLFDSAKYLDYQLPLIVMSASRLRLSTGLFLLAVTSVAFAQTITFESVPGVPAALDGMIISNQFAADYGVSFSFEGGCFPQLAKVGPPMTAFQGPKQSDDTLAENQGCGSFFLTDDGIVGEAPAPLIISYAHPVAAASGVIIDVDFSADNGGRERWVLEARGTNNALLTNTILVPNSFNAGSGLATPWRFSRTNADISFIRIVYSGAKTNGIGLAFDNFSPALPLAPANVGIARTQAVAQLTIDGSIGTEYRVEYTATVPTTNWTILTNIILSVSPQSFTDTTSSNIPQRFYRAVGVLQE